MIRFTKRRCFSCGTNKSVKEGFGGRLHGTCDTCREQKRDRKRYAAKMSLQVVEVVGSRKYHIAEKDAVKSYCRCREIVPLKYGNSLTMLAGLITDPACCCKCRKKLEAVFGEM